MFRSYFKEPEDQTSGSVRVPEPWWLSTHTARLAGTSEISHDGIRTGEVVTDIPTLNSMFDAIPSELIDKTQLLGLMMVEYCASEKAKASDDSK
jgi:hypothetical protein